MKRQERFDTLRNNPEISVLIVGGGINGIGLLRELALQGVDALLIDKSDFCSGASAASTRIIHGGLRYLENGEFRLVRESLKERNRLLKNAPHYVRPLPVTIPIFDWASGVVGALKKFFGLSDKPGSRGALLIKAGLTMYDVFSGRQGGVPAHHFMSRGKSLTLRPRLNPDIVCTATYYDASIRYPERLCLELIQDAEALLPDARALNYVSVHNATGSTVTLKDEVSGTLLDVKPRIVVNATGAWIDFTNRTLRRETQFIGGTKGSHIVIDHPELVRETCGDMLYFANADGRICIFYPFYDRVIAGSTDIPVDDPETALCEESEVDYILDSMREVFPSIKIDRSHIVFRYCGVRPLPSSDASTPGQISRDHSCRLLPPADGIDFPIYSLIGGKWTTFRAFSEQVADQLLAVLQRPRHVHTENLSIGGGKNYPQTDGAKQQWISTVRQKTGLSTEHLQILLDRYGTRAEEVAQFLVAETDAPLTNQTDYSRREIEFLVSQEQVLHLDDIILRRTVMGLLGQVNRPLLEALAEIVASELGWSQEETRAEIERTSKILEIRHGINLGTEAPSGLPV